MAVQRYVFQYRPHPPFDTLEGSRAWYIQRDYHHLRDDPAALERAAQGAHEHHMSVYASLPFEKEGGGMTEDLQEAKLIGWGSKRFVNPRSPRADGVLVPARIAVEA